MLSLLLSCVEPKFGSFSILKLFWNLQREHLSNSKSILSDHFPEDFSILTTLRLEQGTSSVLFGLYTDNGEDQLIIEVGSTVQLFYQDEEGKPEGGNTIVFEKSVNDGK